MYPTKLKQVRNKKFTQRSARVMKKENYKSKEQPGGEVPTKWYRLGKKYQVHAKKKKNEWKKNTHTQQG